MNNQSIPDSLSQQLMRLDHDLSRHCFKESRAEHAGQLLDLQTLVAAAVDLSLNLGAK